MDSGKHSKDPWEYVDFELEVRESSQGGYCVCVLQAPGGNPEEEMRLPFGDEQNLRRKLEELEEALYRSGETRSSGKTRHPSRAPDEQNVQHHSFDEQTVQDFGKDLFGALLDGAVRDSYRISWHEAKRQNKGLRIKLRLQPPELAQLPWEFLYDPVYDQYICLSLKRPLVRYLNVPHPIAPLTVKPPLRILGMVANPSDPTLDDLNVEREKRVLGEATKDLQEKGLVELRWVDEQTFDALRDEMLGSSWHVFHFVGHGDFDPSRKEGGIALADEEGKKHPVGAKSLATLLTDQFPLRLVFLNSCEGARSVEGAAFSNAAATLVRQGIPSVVAMQYEITDDAAIAFARSFYRAIAMGVPVDAAMAVGRTFLSTSMGHSLEWGTPVLYMRSKDGRVFDVSLEDVMDPLSRYRQAVQLAWADGELTEDEVGWLSKLADSLKLSNTTLADVEREVMDDTKEAVLKNQGQPARTIVKVPNLIGRRRSEAISILATVDLVLGDQAEVPRDTIPEGEIVEQVPEAETEVEPGSLISVAVSSGPATVKVPNLAGLKSFEARDALAAVGLQLGDENETPSDTSRENEIIGQYPAAHSRTVLNTPVGITVSSGPEVVIPKLTGRQLSQARADLARANLELDMNEAPSKTVPTGAIIEQNPAAGTKARKGTRVCVTISTGLSTVNVPDLNGLSRSEACSVLTDANLKLSVQEEVSNRTTSEGRVVRQTPKPATEVEQGSSVTVTLRSEPSTTVVPNLVGQELSQARSELSNVGLELGPKNKAPSDSIPEGEIIGQFPMARTKAERGSYVRVTVSSGAQQQETKQQQHRQQQQQQRSRQADEVTVPNLVGQSLHQARNELSDAGLRLGARNKSPNHSVAEGEIMGQFPMARTKAKRGSYVRVTVSSGAQQQETKQQQHRQQQQQQRSRQADEVTVPNLVGQSLHQARNELSDAGLRLGARNKSPSDTSSKGKIVEQNPASQAKVKRGRSIRVTVGSGPLNRNKMIGLVIVFIAVLVVVVLALLAASGAV